jgi:predicted nucleic acid-binding protein
VADAVVDASVWVSRFVRGDVHHERARRWFERRADEGGLLVAPALMPPEVAGAIARRTGDGGLARRALGRLLALSDLRLVPLDRDLAGEASGLAARFALRGADAIYVAVARRLAIPLVSFDREQRERGREAASVVAPA